MTVVSSNPTPGRGTRGPDPRLPNGTDPWALRLPALRAVLAPIIGPIDHTMGKAALVAAYRRHVEALPQEKS